MIRLERTELELRASFALKFIGSYSYSCKLLVWFRSVKFFEFFKSNRIVSNYIVFLKRTFNWNLFRVINHYSFFFTLARIFIACTCAIGTGVNAKGVNTVINIGPPRPIQDYCQEAGRGGEECNCFIIYSMSDFANIIYRAFKTENENFKEIKLKI